MNVLIATGLYPPSIGGPATHAKIIKENLPGDNFNVSVRSFDAVRKYPKIIRHFVYALQLFVDVFKFSPEIIYALDPVSVGIPATLVSKITGRKVVLRLGGDYAWEQAVGRFDVRVDLDDFVFGQGKHPFRVRVLKYLQKITASNAIEIIVPSNYLKRIVVGWGISEEKISVVNNSFSGIAPSDSEKGKSEELKSELGLSGRVILTAGRAVFWKGFESLLDAFAELVKQNDYKDLQLVIAGNGPLLPKLKNKANKSGLDEKVLFPGSVDKGILSKYIYASDLFILNTGYEGLSHTLLEVMSLRTPVLTTNRGGNPEIIKDKESGYLFDYNDVSEIQSTLIKALSSDNSAIIESAFETTRNFTQERMINSVVEIFYKYSKYSKNSKQKKQ